MRTIPTIRIQLPPRIHETPDDEAAVAIPEVAVAPEVLPTGTRSIEILPERAVAAAKAQAAQAALEAAAGPDIPPLPVEPKPTSRYGRRWTENSGKPAGGGFRDSKPGARPAPEGFWRELVYGLTLTLVNLGDSRAVRARKALEARIAVEVDETRFVPVISRQGGVGATTVTTLLGMALAEGRDDRVVALDAHPDRGTLAERVVDGDAPADVRDIVDHAREIRTLEEMESRTTHDRTGLDVVASTTDPVHERTFHAAAYDTVADVAGRFYSVVLTDGASGVLEPVMKAALKRADGLVIVAGGTSEQARLASETVTWLEQNDLAELADNTVVAINTATPGTRYESLDAIEAHFRARVRDVVRIPYDEELVAGAPVRYGALRPDTRDAARDLAAKVMDGLRDDSAA
jgi:MinD-like ATPase involved in chromosome partitioning or flagellar assembly